MSDAGPADHGDPSVSSRSHKRKLVGHLQVSGRGPEGKITIAVSQGRSTEPGGASFTTTSFPATLEGMVEAMRVLASWCDLPSEDVKLEGRRVHERDQRHAAVRDAMQQLIEEDGLDMLDLRGDPDGA